MSKDNTQKRVTCPVLLKADAQGYKLLDEPLPWPPIKDGRTKEELPANIVEAVDLLCRLPNEHIATDDFLVAVSSKEKRYLRLALDEAVALGLLAAQICPTSDEPDIAFFVYRLGDRLIGSIPELHKIVISAAAKEEFEENERRLAERIRAEDQRNQAENLLQQ